MENNLIHIPVLKKELINLLNIKSNGKYLDCTAGYGGHSEDIVKLLNPNTGSLICIDQDQNAINFLKKKFFEYKNITIKKLNFENISLFEENSFDGIIMDIGVSSQMFDDPKRGFSYHTNSKLDMRMDQSQELTAWKIINEYSYDDLKRIFHDYGELYYEEKVIRAIINERTIKSINTTFDLVEIIKKNCSNKIDFRKKHPAKRFFQALRIEVNNEINVLHKGILNALKLLKSSGILIVISFHSIEDRIVKTLFNNLTQEINSYPKEVPISKINKCEYILLTKKPICSSKDELEKNNRSHSAKLRALKKK